MLKLSKFYVKVLIKSPLFLISLLFSIFIFIVQLSALENSSILEYTSVVCYAMMSLNLYFLICTSSVMSKKYEIMDFLESDISKKYLTIILAALVISIISSLIPIVFILAFKNTNISSFFILKGIINIFIILNLSNLLCISVGASVGIILKKWTSIVVSLVIYSFFPFFLFYPLSESTVVMKFLNIYSDSTTIRTNILCDEIFNVSYFCDKLVVLLISILLILVVKIIVNKKKRILSIVSIFSVIVFIIITTFIGFNSVSFIHEYDYSQGENLNYHISSYKMDININNNFTNSVSFQLNIDKPDDSIILELDDLFKINEIRINDKPIKYTHENDKIILDYQTIQKESVNVSISYQGYIHVEDSLGVDTYYCNEHTMNLTDSFSWYPYVNNDNFPIDYIVKINSSSNIYSNLNTQNEGDKYLLEGRTQKVQLFSGQYKDIYDDGIEYVIPSSKDLGKFKISLDKRITSYLNDPHNKLSKNDIDVLKDRKYKKVIVGVNVNNRSGMKVSDNILLLEL
ncbi:hypothetical protein [Clostridium beijerinckii]|uniref:ASC-1-like (ASCH) protein n=1 Tax=Clostridium beijerinckii TaxID=1520 RepID=A0AAX0AWB8_CLOBE|nr:hypothetical protein [Clostridium beijerinckii]NRT87274.1 ASC-1-like (ASCH) protein [Clostridium beijerinckii]NYC72705.1 ASC-1-like (ASCH) protein [Clostridium beijerinckii]